MSGTLFTESTAPGSGGQGQAAASAAVTDGDGQKDTLSAHTTQHTPGPWSQGRTLRTRVTEKFPPLQWAENEAKERRAVFANFTAEDEGRSRRLIAMFERPEDALVGAAAPDLLAVCQAIEDHLRNKHRLNRVEHAQEGQRLRGQMRAAIAKATGVEG